VFILLLDFPRQILNLLKFLQYSFNIRIPTVRLQEYFRFCLDLFCIAVAIGVKNFIQLFERGGTAPFAPLCRSLPARFDQGRYSRDRMEQVTRCYRYASLPAAAQIAAIRTVARPATQVEAAVPAKGEAQGMAPGKSGQRTEEER
jgi:hypothetical protein